MDIRRMGGCKMAIYKKICISLYSISSNCFLGDTSDKEDADVVNDF